MLPLLVTGGCGFIGSNFIRYLLDTDPSVAVINFDQLTYAGNLDNLADLANHPRYRFVHGDIADRQAVNGVLAGASRASSTSPPRATWTAASRIRARSYGPTWSGRRCCWTPPANSTCRVTCRSPPTRSTAASGRPAASPKKRRWPPNSPYAASKAAADLLVRQLCAHLRTAGRSSRAAPTTTARTSSPRS